MSMQTNLANRVKNMSLPNSNGLMPLFEAVVNSIHSIEEAKIPMEKAKISIEIHRLLQSALELEEGKKSKEEIVGFTIVDNGIGFDDQNLASFETLDTDHKANKGCRGVGRLMWLKVFKKVEIESVYNKDEKFFERKFNFDLKNGVSILSNESSTAKERITKIKLSGFNEKFNSWASKTGASIAKSLLEHCLWYFVREGGCPKITLIDDNETIDLDALYDEYMHTTSTNETIEIKGEKFEITHIKFRSSANNHKLSFCAANRLVKEEALNGKISGMNSKLTDENGEFVYSCYISSSFLDQNVRSERTGFEIDENTEGLFSNTDISMRNIKEAIMPLIKSHLATSLDANIQASKARLERFVNYTAPRYRPIVAKIPESELTFDASISDKDLDLLLHKQLAELERRIIADGHTILQPADNETFPDYQARVSLYLNDVTDIKKSDLANYLTHRKVIIDLLQKALQKDENNKYSTEDMIHNLIMPMGTDSSDIAAESTNLWLLDERLAFHDYLASDKTLKSIPITGSEETKEPDLLALNVFDNPLLLSDSQEMPLASIVVVEIKRPMRNDAKAGEEKDPIEQALGYLRRVREGKVTTPAGRPIPGSESIPGYCYIVCDITETIKNRCEFLDLTISSDHMGYFGYHDKFKAYIEVISFDKLLNNAKQRNKAFFDKLGLPSN